MWDVQLILTNTKWIQWPQKICLKNLLSTDHLGDYNMMMNLLKRLRNVYFKMLNHSQSTDRNYQPSGYIWWRTKIKLQIKEAHTLKLLSPHVLVEIFLRLYYSMFPWVKVSFEYKWYEMRGSSEGILRFMQTAYASNLAQPNVSAYFHIKILNVYK